MTSMNKVIDPLSASRMRFSLGHFIVMMGKLEVDTTGVNVHVRIITR